MQADFIQANNLPYAMMQPKEVEPLVDDLAAVAFSVGNSGLGSDLRNGQGRHFYKVHNQIIAVRYNLKISLSGVVLYMS